MFVEHRFVLNPLVKRVLAQKQPVFGFGLLGAATYYRCVAVGTKVLTKDLRWVSAESLEIGDELLGVDEYPINGTRKFRSSVIEDTGIRVDDCYEVITDRGSITVNADHPFLASDDQRRHWGWVKTKDLTDAHVIRFVGEPWECEDGDSWLAGMCDGEGSLSNARLHISQRVDSVLYPRIAGELGRRGISCVEHVEKTQHRNHLGVVNVNGTSNMLQALGTIRPQRLLQKWIDRVDEWGVGLPRDGVARVQAVRSVGTKQIVNLQTSTRTFISEGFVSHNTYSRLKANGEQETWADTVIRVVEGDMSIRKDWYIKSRLPWDEERWQLIATRMANAIYSFRMLPPGRGLWAQGVDHTYERGSMSLNNCAFVEIRTLSADAAWAKDALMMGVGVGFSTHHAAFTLQGPSKYVGETYVIPDSREGWVESVRRLIASYEEGGPTISFDYSEIRPAGSPIKGFGGTASGPEPLAKLHTRLRSYLDAHVRGETSRTRLVVDVLNAIGACVVAGNVRRSAEIALGSPQDTEFLDLKNYDLFPERAELGWMSNNSVVLSSYDDFNALPDLAERVRHNGEPGIFNLINVQKFGRFGEYMPDKATGANPCAEISLESYELCNLVEVFPTRCVDEHGRFSKMIFMDTLELATIYASSVSLLPTHSEKTNLVVARNRRIGVSLSGIADWFDTTHTSEIISMLDKGYEHVRAVNKRMADEAGVPTSVRVTTVKPSGTVSILAGVSSGMHYPPFSRYIRRVRVGNSSPIVDTLINAGVPYENDQYSDNTLVFEFPVDQGQVRGQKDVSVFAKADMVVMLQKWWADNMVSNTLSFDPHREGHQIEDLLAFKAPFIKSISLLPLLDEGSVYAQAPYEQITKAECDRRMKEIKPIDWSKFGGSDGQDSKFCGNDHCEI